MKRIIFICPFFGKLPPHCQLWLNSCARNETIVWLLITDDRREFDYPSNVIVRYSTLAEEKKRYQKKFDFPIALEGIKKLGDYKPLFGYLYEEEIQGYDYWGHIDVYDEIYGNLRNFLTDDLLKKYDKLMVCGHMGLYRNSYEVNRRFMLRSDLNRTYKDVFSSPGFYNFEEFVPGSITRIYLRNGWKICRLDENIADVYYLKYQFTRHRWSDDFNSIKKYRPVPMIFAWEDGALYMYSVEDGKPVKTEFMYIHFRLRKMKVEVRQNAEKYLILPDGFYEMPERITKEFVIRNSKPKWFYPPKWSMIKQSLIHEREKYGYRKNSNR